MLNVGGGEVIVILLVALVVLGPTKLPEAVRQVSRAIGELRKLSAGFQAEIQEVLDVSTEEEARSRGEASTRKPPNDPGGSGDGEDLAGLDEVDEDEDLEEFEDDEDLAGLDEVDEDGGDDLEEPDEAETAS